MKKIILLYITTIFLLIPNNSYSNENISEPAKKWFTSFSSKINAKYTTEKEIIFFKGFNTKLSNLLSTKNFNNIQIDLVSDLINLSNEYIFRQTKYKEEISNLIYFQSNKLFNDFTHKSLNSSHIFLENGIRYTYNFEFHLTFPEGGEIRNIDLEHNGISKYSTLVFLKNDNTLGFVKDFKKIKLISDSIIYGVSDKYSFLKEIKDDKKKLNQDTDNVFKKLKQKTYNITKGKKESEKIKIIYNYILDNIKYSETFSFNDPEVFSGINTFANKNGVCEGYVKIFQYMLNFANISDVTSIRGYVLDASDFPKIGHAWIKIGNKYYDPTFDDPIGQVATKKYSEYIYFGLPYDLFYTNRYTYSKIPSFLKQKSLEYREEFIKKRISALLYKYKNNGYNILKPYLFRYENNIKIDKQITISDLKNIIQYYEVTDFKFIENGIKKDIKTLQFYNITDGNADNLAKQLDYSFNNYYLFKWEQDGITSYRLSYGVQFH